MAGAYSLMDNISRLTKIDRGSMPGGISPTANTASVRRMLGLVRHPPVCMLDDALHENVAPESAPELLSNLESRISNLDPTRSSAG